MRQAMHGRRWHWRVGLMGLLGGLVVAFAADAAGASSPAAGWLQPCRLRGVEHPAQCGVLTRPLDPAAPTGVAIDLHVAVLPALARNKQPDPIFFFAGGPGQSAVALAGPVSRLLARFLNRRDIVLIDQRGTGLSAPLSCDDGDAPQRALGESADPAAIERQLLKCRQALQKLPHGDLRHYATVVAMQDTEAVRLVLGAERINLVGGSYGTRAALEYLRQYPQRVRRAVLDGVAPPDMVLPQSFAVDGKAAMAALLAWCAADPACQRRHPRLGDSWRRLLASLPQAVSIVHPFTGREETLRMTPEMLIGLVRGALYAPVLASALPAALAQADAGRWSALAGLSLVQVGYDRRQALFQGMHFSVVCAEDLPLPERTPSSSAGDSVNDTAGDFGRGLTDLYQRVCAQWPRGRIPEGFYQVPVSPAPVLLLSGALDPVTPPRHGQRVAQSLGDRARHVVVPNAGHGVMGLGCMRDLIFRFVDAAEEASALLLDTGCARGVPRPGLFALPMVEAAR